MKKVSILILVLIMALQLVGCACQRTPDPTDPTQSTQSTQTGVITPDVKENSTAAKLWAEFEQAVTQNNDAAPKDIASILVERMADTFFGEATQLEKDAEFFTGFDNYKITGYKDGAVYMPMMGSIAFVGYVFELEDTIDPSAFLKSLTDNCNPRWNICVEADQTVAGAIGNRVFFLMCPKNMGQ